jgi:predicted metal-dependent enzyme (double-stranded beta helix superfamily)
MIRSLFNLNYKINKHINNLHSEKKFKLLEVKSILEQYKGDDWMDYKVKPYDSPIIYSNMNYTRIPISFQEFNQDKYDTIFGMYLIAWNPFCHTSIHNHPEGGCLMRILEGNIKEQRFMNAESFSTIEILNPGDINYIHDNLGLHRILNENSNTAYSLHIYSPNVNSNKTNQYFLKPSKVTHCGIRRVTDYPIM